MKLSVALATYNEEANLERCLNAIQDIADEIVIVDGGSTDQTIDIAHRFKAQVIQTDNPPNFHINKQKALEASQGDWILNLDADEVVTPELVQDIKQVINKEWSGIKDPKKKKLFAKHQSLVETRDRETIAYQAHQDKHVDHQDRLTNNEKSIINHQPSIINGYYLPRLNIFLGQPLKHGGVYPDGVIRLVRNGQAHYPCQSVHEQIQVEGEVSWLEHDLLHYDSPTFARYIARANRYTDLTAKELQSQNIKLSVVNDLKYLVFKPKLTFLNLYLRHKGFLDGFPGLVWGLFSALHWPIAYMKVRDLYRQESVTTKI